MRTWILFSAFIIAQTIHPNMQYPLIISLFAIVLFIAGVFADYIDFKRKD